MDMCKVARVLPLPPFDKINPRIAPVESRGIIMNGSSAWDPVLNIPPSIRLGNGESYGCPGHNHHKKSKSHPYVPFPMKSPISESLPS